MAAPDPVRRRQRATGRPRPTVQRASLPLPLPVQPTAGECAALLKALIKHLLFQRAQIPYLYDELLRAAQEQQRAEAEAEAAAAAEAAVGGGRRRRRRRSPKGGKRLLKLLAKTEELLASIDAALTAFGVPRRVFLLLGSSSTKPREVFEVLLPQPAAAVAPHGPAAVAAIAPHGPAAVAAAAAGGSPCQQQGAAAPQVAGRARPSRQQRLCQLAVRQLVAGGAELPEGTAHTVPCKLFVLLEGPPATTATAADLTAGRAAAAAVPVPAGFTTKRQFRLGMRKGTHVRLLLGQRVDEEAAEEQQRERQAGEGQQPASSEASMGGSGSRCCAAEGAGPATVHLSQLPDADSQGQAAGLGPQHSSGNTASLPAAAGAAPLGAGSTAGSVWFMARTVLKGLNSGSGSDGVAAGFDGL